VPTGERSGFFAKVSQQADGFSERCRTMIGERSRYHGLLPGVNELGPRPRPDGCMRAGALFIWTEEILAKDAVQHQYQAHEQNRGRTNSRRSARITDRLAPIASGWLTKCASRCP